MNAPTTIEAASSHPPPLAAKLVAVEILLSDPATLSDNVLEAALYLLRERLQAPGPVAVARLSERLEEYADATAESIEGLSERLTRVESKIAAA